MMSRGKPARTDSNQGEIVAVLRDIGACVRDFSAVGGGCPDLAILYRGKTTWIEVKDGEKPPSARRLTPDQRRWHQEAHARGVEVHVVTNADEAIYAVTSEPKRHPWKGNP